MRIFFVCQRVPFPPDRGDKITTFNEIRHLSAQHEVHVFCLGDGRRDLDNIPGLSDYARSVTAVPLNGRASKLRALTALIAGRPLSVAAFAEPELHGAIKRKFIELKPDLIMVYSCNVAQFADHFPQVPRIMQFAELDSSRWGQYARRSPIPLRWIYSIEQRRFFAYERRIAHSFSHALVSTAFEQRDFPGTPETDSLALPSDPEEVVLALPRPLFVYDVRKGRLLGSTDRLPVKLGPVEPVILAVSEKRLGPPSVSSPQGARLGTNAEISVSSTSQAALDVIHLDVIDPEGNTIAYYSGNLLMTDSRITKLLPFAVNDKPGIWTLRATDLLGGAMATAELVVEP